MSADKKFDPSFVNPIVLFIESILIDWWLLRIFSILYKPVPKMLRKEIKGVVVEDIVSYIKGQPVKGNDVTQYHKSALEEGLYYAEVAAYKGNPLFWAGLCSATLLFLIDQINYKIGSGTAYLYFSLSVLSFVGFAKYFKVRFAIYKMQRLVTDA